MSDQVKRIALFMPRFGSGGIERMMVNLARGFARLGLQIDFIVRSACHPYLHALPSSVRLIEFGPLCSAQLLAKSISYLRQERPLALLASEEANEALAVRARAEAGVATLVALRAAVNVTSRLHGKRRNRLVRWYTRRKISRVYAQADWIIAVSSGVADDIGDLAGIAPSTIRVIPNPVITPELYELAASPAPHPWLRDNGAPVILGAGRLSRQKNFELLITAFADVRRDRPCRLIILGEGRRKTRLERLARQLGVARDFALPGFTPNPYAFMARANLFVLSSNWEGSPNALTEALALGVPVVATDCPSGPREMLQGGLYGRLTPPGDTGALARAIAETLDHPLPPERLKAAVQEYTVEKSAARYLKVLGIEPSQP